MRDAPSFFTVTSLALLITGCGGKVLFGQSDGSGGDASTSSTATAPSSASGTSTGTSTATGAGCPVSDPVAGASCDSPGLICTVPDQCCQPTATCFDGVWSISAPACGSICIPCGGSGLECADNAVCVGTQVDAEVLFRCAVDPCQGNALSCACAAGVCLEGQCVSATETQINCDTFTD